MHSDFPAPANRSIAQPLMKHERKKQAASFSGRDALAYSQRVAGEEAASKQHVQKRRRADKGLEVVFNPGAHK